MAITHSLPTNNYGTAKFIVSIPVLSGGSGIANGTHSTLAGAMADAAVGDTIFLRDSVTENITITPGVNIAAWQGSSANTPAIIGTVTMVGAGTSTISGIRLQTNSAALLAVTGSAASIINIENCYLDCTNATGITFSSTSANSQINIDNCKGNLGTTGIGLFAHTSNGTMTIRLSTFFNSGGSSTQSTCASGILNIARCTITFPITTSSTASGTCSYTFFDTSGQTPFTAGGSGLQAFRDCIFIGGTAIGFSADSANPTLTNCSVSSSNANAVSGSGTLTYSPITFFGSSSTVNTSIQVPLQIGPKIYTNGGISFDSGTNLLANYVSTTSWTPVLEFGGGTTGIIYTVQVGRYFRIGSLVFYKLNILLSSKGSSTGAATITGLPIAVLNVSGTACPTSVGLWSLISLGANYTQVLVSPTIGTTSMVIQQVGNNVTQANVDDTGFANTSQISASGWYFAA